MMKSEIGLDGEIETPRAESIRDKMTQARQKTKPRVKRNDRAAAEATPLAERRYRMLKVETLPSCIAALKAARQRLADLQSRIDARRDETMRGLRKYGPTEQLADAKALDDQQYEVNTLEAQAAAISADVRKWESSEERRTFDATLKECEAAAQRGQIVAQHLFVAMRTLFRLYDELCSLEKLFNLACRQHGKSRLRLLAQGAEIPLEETAYFPVNIGTFRKFLAAQLPLRERTPETEYSRIFPHMVFSDGKPPALDTEGDDSLALPEEDAAPVSGGSNWPSGEAPDTKPEAPKRKRRTRARKAARKQTRARRKPRTRARRKTTEQVPEQQPKKAATGRAAARAA